ncbi:NAD-dependent epimerase [Aquabacterium lacunae]|uniref:NAD-dependent epimerase n=1 Tax=Aquabacterium lacunae TaxID=2528630 RepID=A0A4Q9GXZ1_9BURK|nr:NAD-dependent epimerase [Aquabacterium lacunae]TBO31085.1 NAD-dependent epimerase [Aquabacterium lacunae]
MKILITGDAGFIGMHVAARLIGRGDQVVGIDNLNDYYSPKLKQDRLAHLAQLPGADRFKHIHADVADLEAVRRVFAEHQPECVIHLAAQAGVRYSLENPHAYVQSNLVGFVNVLECCRHHAVKHLVYASSSSVYGGNVQMPFSETDRVDHPVSLYAATKKSNELMAHTYSHLFGLPTTGLRFFTVYGPWGRPDMAPMLFARAILAGEPIKIFNHGKMKRDFTFIDDIVDGVLAVADRPPGADVGCDRANLTAATSWAPYKVFNIGNSQPVQLLDFVAELERALGKQTEKIFLPIQPGDVEATFADTSRLEAWGGVQPGYDISLGVDAFAAWYLKYAEDGRI